MAIMTQQEIIEFCNQHDYNIKETGNGRWIDQKCASDVVTVVADCIYNFVQQNEEVTFTTSDIWHFSYTIENVQAIFKKPGVESYSAKNEYDKFFQQPMEMLAYSGVLGKMKKGRKNCYWVENRRILEYIAIRERNALLFLKIYIEKVLRDSGLFHYFERFFELQTQEAYEKVKYAFSEFIIKYTKINGEVECNRIFIKVLNPLAYFNNSRGTEKGRLSKNTVTYDMLMYNRNNFRDIYSDKPKGITRKEYAALHSIEVNEEYYHYQSTKAKRFLRLFNEQNRNNQTEHFENGHNNDPAIHMHHIFPQAIYPEICYYPENIIALTPTQHLSYAHPNGRTQEIDEQYQHLLLLSKACRIYENLTGATAEKIYDFYDFLFVLNVGFDNDEILEIADMDFTAVVNAINLHYAK